MKKINIIAHSRGADVATTALRELVIEARGGGRDPLETYDIGDLVLAAPDLDFEVTLQRLSAEGVFTIVDRLTIYVSKGDQAIGIAAWLFDSLHRIGQLGYEDLTEEQKEGLATSEQASFVDVRVKGGGWGHNYFHSSPAVSSDLILLLRYNLEPGAENGRPLVEKGTNFWSMTSKYPQMTGN